MDSARNARCIDCTFGHALRKHASEDRRDVIDVQCRRYPPVVAPFPNDAMSAFFNWTFPILPHDLWCGEFQPRKESP